MFVKVCRYHNHKVPVTSHKWRKLFWVILPTIESARQASHLQSESTIHACDHWFPAFLVFSTALPRRLKLYPGWSLQNRGQLTRPCHVPVTAGFIGNSIASRPSALSCSTVASCSKYVKVYDDNFIAQIRRVAPMPPSTLSALFFFALDVQINTVSRCRYEQVSANQEHKPSGPHCFS
jgi:hypothetical protein